MWLYKRTRILRPYDRRRVRCPLKDPVLDQHLLWTDAGSTEKLAMDQLGWLMGGQAITTESLRDMLQAFAAAVDSRR
jgi:hypothetical protein